MQDTAPTVGPFPGESQSRSVPVEAGPPVDELLDPERPFLHQNSHRRFVAKAIPCPEGVLKVELDPVLFRKGYCDPALRFARIALDGAVLGQDRHACSRFGQFHRGTEARDADPDDDGVELFSPDDFIHDFGS